MQYTPNFNFNLPEGTDLWNYLTQTNPNFSALDTLLKNIQDLTVTTATEVTAGTAHAITRTLPDANVIRFTATSNWATGDTMTLDGTPVTPLKTDGTTLKTGDYIIGSAVLMIKDSTRLTVLVASSPDASDINYTNDGTHTWLTANKVEGAINEAAAEIDAINSNISKNNLGSFFNITGYTSDKFTIPNDGYVYIEIPSGTGYVSIVLYGADESSYITSTISQPTDAQSIFVRKGMKILCVGSGTYRGFYLPLE